MDDAPRQLEMVLPGLEGLPPIEIPPACALRTYRPGDEEAWARIMNDCVGEGWTARRCLDELVRRPEFSADGCFFAVVEGVPEGTATAWIRGGLPADTGYVHMVGVAPARRGMGLGRLVTLAVLHWFRAHGFRRAILHTDDWRLPAIGLYLQLGFEPVLFDEEHVSRWRAIRERLAGRAREQDAAV